MIAASWSRGWTETRLKVGAEDGMVGVDADMDMLKKAELKWWRKKIHLLKKAELKWWRKNTEKNQKAPFSPMPRELHVPMKTRRRDHYCKWWLYGSLYWNKMTATRKGNTVIKKQMATNLLRSQSTRSSSTIRCVLLHMWKNGVDVEHKKDSLDYWSVRRIVNQCEISHLWCQWESRHKVHSTNHEWICWSRMDCKILLPRNINEFP